MVSRLSDARKAARHPWPVWLLVPGAALAAVTVGVQVIRHQQRDR